MPKLNDTPDTLKPFIFHGVDLSWRGSAKEAVGTCPFCSRDKFSVNIETGLYRCLVCASGTDKGGGNARVFVRLLWEQSYEAQSEYGELTEHRKLVNGVALASWGVCKSIVTGEWLIPGYGVDGAINQVYRYTQMGERMLIMPTPNLGHHLHGVNLYDPSKPIVDIMEGFWDGVAWWEVLVQTKLTEDSILQSTGNQEVSMLADRNVLAVPGCGSIGAPFSKWLPLLAGKVVNLMFDNDHPKIHPRTKQHIPPAGYEAMQRAAQLMAEFKDPPAEINFIQWGGDGKDHDSTLPHGTDVRDVLAACGSSVNERHVGVADLLARIASVPVAWVPSFTGQATATDAEQAAKQQQADKLGCIPCTNWKELVLAFRKAMKWTEGLDCALAVMLSSVISTESVGDQLWIMVIGPPACGKSTLCEALSVARKYVYPKDTLTRLTSGYQTDKDGGENMSMAEQLRDMTLVINDGDTLLQLPNLNQVLSQLRAFYGRNLRSQYGNKMSTDHEAINTSIILCGTSAMKNIDTSELGQRFLSIVVMQGIDEALEDEIIMRMAHRAARNVTIKTDSSNAQSQQDPAMTYAMQLTGGYVNYLRENSIELLSAVDISDEQLYKCSRLAKFTACMRSRPSYIQDEVAEREVATRLTSQIVRLAMCMAAVLNYKEVNADVMHRVTKVAMDTARGITVKIVQELHDRGEEEGLEPKTIAHYANLHPETVNKLMKFLREILVVEPFIPSVIRGMPTPKPKWRLTERFNLLYEEVING